MSWRLCLMYDSGKRFIIPIDKVLEEHVDKETLDKIKAAAKKELRKL